MTSAPSPWMIVPFGLLLGAAALGQALRPAGWARHQGKVAFGLGAVTVGYYLLGLGAGQRLAVLGEEYVSFIALIGSLYVVAGGIHLRVEGRGGPGVNTVFLLIGAVAANVLGTTGASVLLIRPWLRLNRARLAAHHVAFFIFLVANVGGCLTPVGDPPLLLGYLQGVPFWWVTRRCWPMWAVAVGLLLGIFYVLDRRHTGAKNRLGAGAGAGLRLRGWAGGSWRAEGLGNVVWLAVILGAVFLGRPLFAREGLMAAAAAASYFTTRRSVHAANQFSFHPLAEVAVLFAGIFATMAPAVDWLGRHAAQVGRLSPARCYWSSGMASSLLDNAPTYASFLSATEGRFGPGPGTDAAGPEAEGAALLVGDREASMCLLAISLGAVFFGAMTYIGNGPNLMIKAIADEQGAPSPGFGGFVGRFSVPYLLPVLVVVWVLFLRG